MGISNALILVGSRSNAASASGIEMAVVMAGKIGKDFDEGYCNEAPYYLPVTPYSISRTPSFK